MKTNKIIESKIAPNPMEASYWVDLTQDAYGKVIKAFNGSKWVPISGGGADNIKQELSTAPGSEYNVMSLKIISEKLNELLEDVADIKDNSINYWYGVEWDSSVSDPALTRIGNPLLHKSLPIQSKMKGCVAKEGVINYYLNPNDWSKKADNSESKLDGTDGDVKVYVPQFYINIEKEGTILRVKLSTIKIDSNWVEVPEVLVDAYRCTVCDGKTASVVNTTAAYRGGGNRSANDVYLNTDPFRSDLGKPRTALSLSTMRAYAKAAGSEIMSVYEYYPILYWLCVVEFATLNSQEAFNSKLTAEGYHQGGLGNGMTEWDWTNWGNYNGNYPITPCGYTNKLGNFSGEMELVIPETTTDKGVVNTKTLHVNRYRGIENIFGDVYTILEGVIIKRENPNEASKVYATNNPENYDSTLENKEVIGIETPVEGYISNIDVTPNGIIIPTAAAGSSTTYLCDRHYCNPEYTGSRALWVGGGVNYGSYAGLGCFASDYGLGGADTFAGFRTVTKVKK